MYLLADTIKKLFYKTKNVMFLVKAQISLNKQQNHLLYMRTNLQTRAGKYNFCQERHRYCE